MKKRSAQSLFFVFLICLSVGSYAYLSVGSKQSIPANSANTSENLDKVNSETEESKTINLPDIQMLRKVVEAGKRFLPAS